MQRQDRRGLISTSLLSRVAGWNVQRCHLLCNMYIYIRQTDRAYECEQRNEICTRKLSFKEQPPLGLNRLSFAPEAIWRGDESRHWHGLLWFMSAHKGCIGTKSFSVLSNFIRTLHTGSLVCFDSVESTRKHHSNPSSTYQ